MKPGKIFIVLLLVLFLGLVAWEVFNFHRQGNEAQREWQAVQAKLKEAEDENAKLAEELQYYSRPENLEKELRARFNYKYPGESMIILVPASSTGAAATGSPSTVSPANP